VKVREKVSGGCWMLAAEASGFFELLFFFRLELIFMIYACILPFFYVKYVVNPAYLWVI